ncbi:MAG: hypothetical protein LBK25_07760 [Treponema sp.]|nr:hypothetical protein [Treponema sp.]
MFLGQNGSFLGQNGSFLGQNILFLGQNRYFFIPHLLTTTYYLLPTNCYALFLGQDGSLGCWGVAEDRRRRSGDRGAHHKGACVPSSV